MNHRPRRALLPALGGLAVTACLLLPPPASAAVPDGCSRTSSTSDFNGDGYDDAAVGDPYATVNGEAEAGAVTVRYGGPGGEIGGGGEHTVLTQASFGEAPEAGDHFGWDVVLAPTDLASDCAQLLIGSPGEDLNGAVNAGVAHLVTDLPDREGTPAVDALPLTQADAGGTVETGDEFGYAVAVTGVLEEDGRRLVIGAPGENVGSATDAGAVNVWTVDRVPVGLTELRQGRQAPLGAVRLPGTPQSGDRFGASLAVGAVDLAERSGDEVAQGLIIGAPGDTIAGHDGAGSVTVLQESFQSATLLSQDSAGVPGTAEAGDHFGYSVALSPRDGDAPRTLAVGAPGENVGTTKDAGTVTLFRNAGERFVPRAAFSQGSPGVPGTNEAGDQFGYALTFAYAAPTLMVGVPGEDVAGSTNTGAVQPVRVPGAQLPLQYRPKIVEMASGEGIPQARFGRSVGALFGRSENIVLISSLADDGVVHVLSDRAGTPRRAWVPGPGAKRYGWAISN